MASSVVPRLSTSRLTSASCTAFHPAHTAPWWRLERTASRPAATQPPPAPSPTAPPAYPPTHTPSPAAAVLACSASRLDNLEAGWRGSSPCVSSPPSARAGGGPRTAPASLCGGCASPPRVGGKTPADEEADEVPPPRAALHPAAVSCAPCDTVHTHPAKHHATASSEQCAPLTTTSTLSLPVPSALQRARRALHTTVLVQQ
jgi:hypothetical protein